MNFKSENKRWNIHDLFFIPLNCLVYSMCSCIMQDFYTIETRFGNYFISKGLVSKLQLSQTGKYKGGSLHLEETFRDPFYLQNTIKEVIEAEDSIVRQVNCPVFPRAIFTKRFPQKVVGTVRFCDALQPEGGKVIHPEESKAFHQYFAKGDYKTDEFVVMISRNFAEIHAVGIPGWIVKRDNHQIRSDAAQSNYVEKFLLKDEGFEDI